MNKDEMRITVLEDGSLKIEVDRISAPNHLSAESFLHDTIKLCGGPHKQTRKQGHAHHGHGHGQAHQH